jgi:hypothetical protein
MALLATACGPSACMKEYDCESCKELQAKMDMKYDEYMNSNSSDEDMRQALDAYNAMSKCYDKSCGHVVSVRRCEPCHRTIALSH